MSYSISLNVRKSSAGWLLIFICGYSIAAITALKTYIQPLSVNWILGTIALLVSAKIQATDSRSMRFLWPALLFAFLYLVIPAKTILFASIAMSVFFMIETFAGKINYLATACVILMSPIVDYATNLFSFPIRLFLTSKAGKILQIIYPETRVEGNIIITNSSEFSVDPACMGLHMLVTSLLAGLILVSMTQQNQKRVLSIPVFALYMAVIVGLNIFSNLFRILCLVNFNIGSGSFLHDAMGLLCFLVYVILPAMFISRYGVAHFGRTAIISKTNYPVTVSKRHILENAILMMVTVVASATGKNSSVNDRIAIAPITLSGYTCSQLADRITKLENEKTLIYIKPIAGFYSSDHQPMICWSGSGYEFRKVQEKQLGDCKVYTAVLQKGNDLLYTSWWYENGTTATSSQIEWRWNSLRSGAKYALINVTSGTREDLESEVTRLLALKLYGKMLVGNGNQ